MVNAANPRNNHCMACGDYRSLWQQKGWPHWKYDRERLLPRLAAVHSAQGQLLGRMQTLGLAVREQATLRILTDDVLKTSEIEGEHLSAESARSSLARRLGVEIGALAPADRRVEGVVEMVLDATQRFALPLTVERLLGWHASLFPTGYSGLSNLRRRSSLRGLLITSGSSRRKKAQWMSRRGSSGFYPVSTALFRIRKRRWSTFSARRGFGSTARALP